mgnify:FL=1
MKILVYNPTTNKMETYNRELNDPMPYSKDRYLTVREFRGSSNSDILWTDRRTIEAFNRLRELYGKSIPVGYGFKRIREGGHSDMSQHYAGVALDVGQKLNNEQRSKLREIATNYKLYTYVEPESLTPTWVHIDTRAKNPACARGGYPTIRQGSKGVYVAVLQDALNFLGYSDLNIDGIFGSKTRNAVVNYQRKKGLSADGIVGCNTWTILTKEVADNR